MVDFEEIKKDCPIRPVHTHMKRAVCPATGGWCCEKRCIDFYIELRIEKKVDQIIEWIKNGKK